MLLYAIFVPPAFLPDLALLPGLTDEWNRRSRNGSIQRLRSRAMSTGTISSKRLYRISIPVCSHNYIQTALIHIQRLAVVRRTEFHGTRAHATNQEFVLDFISAIVAALRVFFRGRHDTALEILALRRQGQCSNENIDAPA
jgi:hypothetical protein